MTGGRLAVSDEVSAKVIDGEAVIINLTSGAYHSATGSGALAWSLIERGHDRAAVAEAVARHYGVDPQRVDADLGSFYDSLLAQSLVVASDDGPADPERFDGDHPAGDYTPPVLETYTDMADLLALDPPMPGLKDIPWAAAGDDGS